MGEAPYPSTMRYVVRYLGSLQKFLHRQRSEEIASFSNYVDSPLFNVGQGQGT